MRVSQQLTKTLREVPRDSEAGNQELLVRGGFVRQLTSGIYSYLPPGNRVIRKISQIVREEMDRAGGQEVSMPVLQPRDLWDKQPASGPTRAEAVGDVRSCSLNSTSPTASARVGPLAGVLSHKSLGCGTGQAASSPH